MKLKLLVTSDVVCCTAIFIVVTQRSSPQTQWEGALRDDTKNCCVADYQRWSRSRIRISLTRQAFPDCARPLLSNFWRLEQLFAVLTTSSKFCLSDHEQLQFEQNVGLEHISSKKKSTISQKTSIHAGFLECLPFFFNF